MQREHSIYSVFMLLHGLLGILTRNYITNYYGGNSTFEGSVLNKFRFWNLEQVPVNRGFLKCVNHFQLDLIVDRRKF